GDPGKALEFYTGLLSDDPDYVGAYFHLARLYAEQDDNKAAFDTYDKGIEIAKKLSDHHALSELMSARSNLEMEDLI
ncbi:MAG: tetratricopeptide repeat protein, partial [Bacteroidetes bacterium]